MTDIKPSFFHIHFSFIVMFLNPSLLLLYRPPFTSIEREYFLLSQMLPRKYFLSKATFVTLWNTAWVRMRAGRITIYYIFEIFYVF